MILVEIIGKFRQLTRAKDRGRLDHEGQVFLLVSLADVQIEHPGDQGALQPRARALQNIKARAGQLGAAFEVDDAQGGAEVPMRKGLEVEFARLADGLEHDILVLSFSVRYAFIGDIRERGHECIQVAIHIREARVEFADLITDEAHRIHPGSPRRGVLHPPDLLRDRVAFCLQLFGLPEQGAALFIEL